MAAPQALREVRCDDRPPLGWNCRLLQAREQGRARLRRGLQQQDPRAPTPRLWPTRRGVPAPQDPHVDAPGNLISTPIPPTRLRDEPVHRELLYLRQTRAGP